MIDYLRSFSPLPTMGRGVGGVRSSRPALKFASNSRRQLNAQKIGLAFNDRQDDIRELPGGVMHAILCAAVIGFAFVGDVAASVGVTVEARLAQETTPYTRSCCHPDGDCTYPISRARY